MAVLFVLILFVVDDTACSSCLIKVGSSVVECEASVLDVSIFASGKCFRTVIFVVKSSVGCLKSVSIDVSSVITGDRLSVAIFGVSGSAVDTVVAAEEVEGRISGTGDV